MSSLLTRIPVSRHPSPSLLRLRIAWAAGPPADPVVGNPALDLTTRDGTP